MLWMDKFHRDHMAIIGILPKLEGNLKDIECGEAGENIIWDLEEFAELIKTVIIPHFVEEDKTVYPKAATVDEDARKFILGMYEEHNLLYEAFEGFLKSMGWGIEEEVPGPTIDRPKKMISMSWNISKEDVLKSLEKVTTVKPLESIEFINKEGILKYGYKIVQMLKEHIEKEETTVAELIKKANESKRG